MIRPSPIEGESIMGYLLRLTEENVFDTPFALMHMGKLLTVKDLVDNAKPISSGEIQLKSFSTLVGELEETIDTIIYPIVFPARILKVAIHDFNYNDVPANYIRFQRSRVCIDCLIEHYFYRYIWDLAPFTACPKHQTLLTDVCPQCNKQLSWARSHIHKCQCGYDLYGIPRTVIANPELKLSIHIAVKLHAKDLYTSEQKALLSKDELRMQIPDIINYLDMAELKNKKRARIKIRSDYDKMPNLLLHNHFLNLYDLTEIKPIDFTPLTKQTLNQTQAAQHLGVTDSTVKSMVGSMISCSDDGGFLYQDILDLKYKLAHAISYETLINRLNVSRFITDKIIANGLIKLMRGPNKDNFGDRLFDQRELTALFNRLSNKVVSDPIDAEKITLERYIKTRCVATARSVPEILTAVFSDKIKLTAFNPDAGLPTLEFDSQSLRNFTSPTEFILKDYLTVSDVCNKLNIYRDAVYRTLKTGLLPYVELDTGKSTKQKSIHIDDLKLFQEQYVFIKELAFKLNTTATNLADKLIDEGIYPVSGPSVDNNLIYIFNRPDLTSIDLASVANKNVYKSRTGRKTKAQQRLSPKSEFSHLTLLDADQVRTLLNSSIQKVSQLVKKNLLAEVNHNGSLGNKRFFDEIEIYRFLDTFKNNPELISIELAAIQLNESPKRFYNNWLKFRRLETVEDGLGNKYVPKNELAKIASFKCSAYSAADAAERLGVDRSHISNLKKLGKLTPISGPGVDVYGNFFYSIEDIEAFDDGEGW